MMRCITQGGETSGGYTKKLIVEDKKQNIEFNTILVRIDILIETHIGKYLMAVQYQDILQAFKLKFMDGQLNLLIESLTLLGLAYQEQREKLPEFVGDIMTDILDDFSNAFFLVPQLIEKGLLSEKALQKVVSCYVQIQVNLRHPEWSKFEAFEKHESWNWVRELARDSNREIVKTLS